MASIKSYKTAKGLRYKVLYRKPGGEQTTKRGFVTKKVAELWAADNTLRVAHNTYISPSASRQDVGSLIEAWLSHTARLERSTVVNRQSTARVWVSGFKKLEMH